MAPRKEKKPRNYVCLRCERWFNKTGIEEHNRTGIHQKDQAFCGKCMNRLRYKSELAGHKSAGHCKKVSKLYYKKKGIPIPQRAGALQQTITGARAEDAQVENPDALKADNDENVGFGAEEQQSDDDDDYLGSDEESEGAEEENSGSEDDDEFA